MQSRADYSKTMGADFDTDSSYRARMPAVLKAAEAVLHAEMAHIRAYLKSKGQWRRAIMGGDGAWTTPGHASPHGMFIACAQRAWGALLGYHLMSRNDPERPFMSTTLMRKARVSARVQLAGGPMRKRDLHYRAVVQRGAWRHGARGREDAGQG